MDLGIRGKRGDRLRRVERARARLRRGAGGRGGGSRHQRPRGRGARGDRGGDPRPARGAVTAVAGDITTEEVRAAVLAACPEADILVTNAGGPPPGIWSDWEPRGLHQGDRRQHADADRADAGGAAGDDRPRLGAGGQHHLGAVKSPHPQLGLSNTARTGLTGFVAGTSRQVASQRGGDQQPAAGHPRHRPRRRARQGGGGGEGHRPRRGAGRARGDDPGPALRHAGGVRRRLRLPLLAARRLHRRAELVLDGGANNITI